MYSSETDLESSCIFSVVAKNSFVLAGSASKDKSLSGEGVGTGLTVI
jgi:hypothetical protein